MAATLADLAASWAEPAAWEGSTDAGTELPNATWGRIALTEVVVQGWDPATATDRPIAFVPQTPFPPRWGTPTMLPDTAPLLDRVVAATGRQKRSGSARSQSSTQVTGGSASSWPGRSHS